MFPSSQPEITAAQLYEELRRQNKILDSINGKLSFFVLIAILYIGVSFLLMLVS